VTSRIAVIAIDAQQPRVVADFWCAVLGWEVSEVDQDGVSIAPPDRAWPAIDVFAVPERKAVKNRLHLDLRADGSSTDKELQRLLSLGCHDHLVMIGARARMRPYRRGPRPNSLPPGA